MDMWDYPWKGKGKETRGWIIAESNGAMKMKVMLSRKAIQKEEGGHSNEKKDSL